ncbi:hypothetical protein [Arachidicoccus sp.]|uniref:hypothetical protein n=1 Tax=Arachidicoccus sp. TaxID=1872624 RepID=UPI003D215A5B
MQDLNYPIYLKLKIPSLTKIFKYSLIICIIISVSLGIFLLPSGHYSEGTMAIYDVPKESKFEISLLLIAILGIPIFFILASIRYKRKAFLQLTSMNIIISDYKTIKYYPVNAIKYMTCNDAFYKGVADEKLTIDFKDEDNNLICMRLIDYSQSDQLMDTLLAYKNIKFNITENLIDPEELDT